MYYEKKEPRIKYENKMNENKRIFGLIDMVKNSNEKHNEINSKNCIQI